MTSLLSIFDPSSLTFFPSWIFIFFLFILPVKQNFWKVYSINQLSYSIMVSTLLEVFKSKKSLVFVSLFMFLLLMNLMGLLPYGFSHTSHFSFNLFLGLTMWLATMIWFFKNFTSAFLAHLTPLGCPMFLIPFMVLVEAISTLIRPVTLSLRMMSNMMAGHMIITLLSESIFTFHWSAKIIMMPVDIMFYLFEMAVAVIQAYVFTMLMKLYWDESSDD